MHKKHMHKEAHGGSSKFRHSGHVHAQDETQDGEHDEIIVHTDTDSECLFMMHDGEAARAAARACTCSGWVTPRGRFGDVECPWADRPR